MEWYKFDCGCKFPIIDGHVKLDIEKVPLTCKRTWDLIGMGFTKGVFQLESPLGRHWAKRLKPESIEHLAALGAILRPGSLRALDAQGISTTEHYCLRKNKEEEVTYYHPALEPILNTTYGVMCYQEQAMEIAKQIAGFNLQQADELRKAIGKKLAEEMSKVEIKFMEGCRQTKIVTEEQARQIFDWIKESQRYSFNKSHAVCYAMNGYRCAYCKAHFPVDFYTSWLSHVKEKQKKQAEDNSKQERQELISEAKLMDIDVLPPNLCNLEPNFYTDGKIITFGLSNIKGMGPSVVKKLIEALEHCPDFKKLTWFEFLTRLAPAKDYPNRIGGSVLSKIIAVGALRDFGNNRTRMIAELDAWEELSDGQRGFIINHANEYTNLLDAMKVAAKLKKEGGGTHSATHQSKILSQIQLLENPPTKLEDSPNWIASTEEMLLGVPITCTRMDACDQSAVNTTCKDFITNNIKTGSIILGVEIQSVRETKTKTGKTPGAKMANLYLTDGTCSIEAVCWPEAYKQYAELLTKGNTIITQGYRDRTKGSFVINRAWQADLLVDE